jgi:hypothetical protein
MRSVRLGLLLLLAVAACGKSKPAGPPPACKNIGDQCELPTKGPLGVCNSQPCKPGETPPCMTCMPQH